MTETMDWVTKAQALKAELLNIEQAAGQGRIPLEAMEEMRRGVDHCRNTLWDVVIAAGNAEHARDAAILAARLVRIQEMCERIVEAIATGRVWTGTPGLGRFLASLEATERSVKALFEDSAASHGG